MSKDQLTRYRVVVIMLCTLCLCLAIQVRSDRNVKEWQESYICELEELYDNYAQKNGHYPPPQPTVKPIKSIFTLD